MADKARVAVLISGRGTNMTALIYAAKAADCPFDIVLVSGDRPDAAGFDIAAGEGVDVARLPVPAEDRQAFITALGEALRQTGAEFVVLAGFMRILPQAFVEEWRGRMINIHPSLLPKYPGLGTHAAALAAGDRVTGCTVHLVTPELDAGPILAQTEVAVLPGDTVETLAERVRIAEHQLLPHALAELVTRERDPAWIEARIGEIALALRETRTGTAHGVPGWKVGSPSSDKFFAILFNRHHGEAGIGVLVKCDGQDEMAELIDADPELYFRPAYYGASNWIGIRLDRAGVDWDHVADWIERSWAQCAPARLTRAR